jgi:putative oxidoreductase
MMIVRRLARPMLASNFVVSGVDTLANPEPRVQVAQDVAEPVAAEVPGLPQDTELLVRVTAGVQVGAGALLALNRFPRISALALAATLVPTTAAAHRFWEHEDPAARADQRFHFMKNVGLLGGLLLAAIDTEGRPSITWRARHAASRSARQSRREARLAARAARRAA